MLIADYWLVRRKKLELEDLYLAERRLRRAGTRRRSSRPLAGCAAAWGGLVVPALRPLYDYAWFVGFGVAFVVHVMLMQRRPVLSPSPSPES